MVKAIVIITNTAKIREITILEAVLNPNKFVMHTKKLGIKAATSKRVKRNNHINEYLILIFPLRSIIKIII